jgi:hypothetical protein
MLLVAVAAIAAGTFGPIYLREVDHSVLLSTLRAAPVGNSGLTLLPAHDQNGLDQLRRATDSVPRGTGGAADFGAPILTRDIGVTTTSLSTGQGYQSELVSRTGVCRHLSFVSGVCPTLAGTVAVSTRSARALGLTDGDGLVVARLGSVEPIDLRITGIFRPGNPRAAFWWGENDFGFGLSFSTSKPLLDDVFASPGTVSSAATSEQISHVVQRPLVIDALTPGNVAGFESALTRFTSASRARGVTVSSQVGSLLDRAAADEHTTNTIVVVVDLQLVLLALLVLYFVAARTAEAREDDVRLAELRGFSRSDAAVVALLESLVVLGAAVPLGIVVAWLAGFVATPHLFVPGVAPSIDLLSVGAAVASFLAGVAATVLASRQLILRRTTLSGRRPRGGLVVDAVAVTLAVVAFVEVAVAGVASGAHTDPLAAFAPGLLAFGVGVVLARLLPLLSRPAVSFTHHSSWPGLTLAVRRLARRSELSRHVVLVSLAVGLVTFAIAGWDIAAHNRFVRGGFDVGASRVLTVNARQNVDFLDAVRRADPTASQAMAVVREDAPDGVLLAVDATRLSAVSSWPVSLSPLSVGTIARRLAPPTAPAVLLSGRAVRITLDSADATTPPPALEAVVFDDSVQSLSTVQFGPLRAGRATYQAALGGDCPQSCRIVDLALTWSPSHTSPQQSISVPIVVTSLSDQSVGGVWSTVSAGFSHAGHWVGESPGVRVGYSSSGLAVTASVDADGAPSAFGPADVPRALPAVVTGSGDASVGLDGGVIGVRPVATVNALPVVGTGTMVDLPLVERLQSGPMMHTTLEVWLASGADPGIVERLRHQGIAVTAVRTVAARVSRLSQSGASLAYALFLLAAVTAAVLVVGSTVFGVTVAARRRTVEFASLKAVGIDPRSLRRSLVLEQLLLLGTGMVAGVAAGVTATIALPSLPETFAPGPGPPLTFGLPWAALGVILGAVIVSLATTVVLAAHIVVNQASADRLGGER